MIQILPTLPCVRMKPFVHFQGLVIVENTKLIFRGGKQFSQQLLYRSGFITFITPLPAYSPGALIVSNGNVPLLYNNENITLFFFHI